MENFCHPYRLDDLKENSRIMIVGKENMENERLSLVEQIITRISKAKLPVISIISPYEHIRQFYQNHFPNAIIENEIDNGILNKCIYQATSCDNTATNHILVLDNCITVSSISKIFSHIMTILMKAETLKISCIMITSNEMHLTPMIRSHLDTVFLFSDDSTNYRMILWRYYGKMFKTFDEFDAAFNACTRESGVMVIDLKSICTYRFSLESDTTSKNYDCYQDESYSSSYDSSENSEDESQNSEGGKKSPCTSYHNLDGPDNDNVRDGITIGHLKMEYSDDNYQVSFSLTNPNNYHIVELLCNHMIAIKNIKTEQMKMINENLKIQTLLKKRNASDSCN
jgi:hypothetical protein